MLRRLTIAVLFVVGGLAVMATEPNPVCERDDDAFCTRDCAAAVEETAAVQAPLEIVVTGSCGNAPPSEVVECECRDADRGYFTRMNPAGAGCALRDERSTRCLIQRGEFPACDVDGACQQMCEAALARVNEARTRVLDVSLREQRCQRDNCSCTLDVDDLCVEVDTGELKRPCP